MFLFLDTVATDAETFVHHILRMIACVYGSSRCISLFLLGTRRIEGTRGSLPQLQSHRWGVSAQKHAYARFLSRTHVRTHARTLSTMLRWGGTETQAT